MSTRPLLTILLPVRNGAEDLPAYLESASRYADAIVALDDGSTDKTRRILRAHPLVKVLLENPRRTTYSGWNDAANRNALLEAAGQLDPQWLLSLDADERIDASDGAALRAFLETDALPGLAYYVRCYPTETENGRYSPVYVWVPRLFAYEPGQRMPSRRLHFAPIPVSIPRAAYVYTTFRIQHLGGMTPRRRQARYEKYREADPDSHYWPDYTILLDETPAEHLETWAPRDPDTASLYLDAVKDEAAYRDVTEDDSLTIIATPAHRGLASDSSHYELIITGNANAVVDRRLVESASGSIVLALPPDVIPDEAAFDIIVQEHAGGYGMVAPAIAALAGVGWTARWSRWQTAATRSAPELSILDVRPTWCSYRRPLLLEALSVECPPPTVAALNTRLHLADYPCVQSTVRFMPAPSNPRVFGLLRLAFNRGRSDASGLIEAHRLSGRLVQRRGRRGAETRTPTPAASEPLPALLGATHAAGSIVELARPRRGVVAIAVGRPQLALLVILSQGEHRRFLVVSWSAAKRSVRALIVPAWAEIERPNGSVVTLDDALPKTWRIPRFLLHEHVSRPFSVQIDDVVRIRSKRSLDSLESRDLFAAAMSAGLRDLRSAETTVDRMSLGIFLMSARRADVRTLAPWTSSEHPLLDPATASDIGKFFAGHLEVDRRDQRERLRLVKWG